MILSLDCGNTKIKWQCVFQNGTAKETIYGVGDSAVEIIFSLQQQLSALFLLKKLRIASVRSNVETMDIKDSFLNKFPDLEIFVASVSEQSVFGFKNGYLDKNKLGLDRWLAMLGAFNLSMKKPCIVIDMGTAITIDAVNGSGVHVGGYICPGLGLMRNALQSNTRRIIYDSDHLDDLNVVKAHALGRSTMECVEHGCFLMAANFLVSQTLRLISLLGDTCQIYLTGGDASLFLEVLPKNTKLVSDLVFIGLDIAASETV